jgi:hypothetical protein
MKMPNPTKEGYRTAHRQNKDGSYHFCVMPADIFRRKVSKPGTPRCNKEGQIK